MESYSGQVSVVSVKPMGNILSANVYQGWLPGVVN